MYNPDLSPAKKKKEHYQGTCNSTTSDQKIVEDQAINLVGFSEYLLEAVNTSQKLGRWLSPEELFSLVEDFFGIFYPGTTISPIDKERFIYEMELSLDAKRDLSTFINKNSLKQTNLNKSGGPVKCFDPRKSEKDKRVRIN